MKTMGIVMATVLMTVYAVVVAVEESSKLPTSWNRCSCSVAPAVKTATETCSSHTNNADLRDCILKNVGVYDGNSFDVVAAEEVIDQFNATSQQKESLKKSLHSCEPQSHHDAEKLRTCAANVLRRRCLTDPKTVCNKHDE